MAASGKRLPEPYPEQRVAGDQECPGLGAVRHGETR